MNDFQREVIDRLARIEERQITMLTRIKHLEKFKRQIVGLAAGLGVGTSGVVSVIWKLLT